METGKIFVGGLSWDTEKDALQSYFSQYGEVTDCVVMKNQANGKSRGFGFVTFGDASIVDVVLSAGGHKIDGRAVDAKACSARGQGGNQGGQRGGQRGGPGYQGRTTKIFVGGLPNDADEDNMKSTFGRFGKVTDVVIMYDQEKQRPRGFGFLTFDNEDAVESAVAEHFVDFNGKKVECKRAEPRQGGGGGRGGRGGGRGGYQNQGWGGMGDGGQGWGQSNMYGGYGQGGQQGGYGGGYQQGYDQSWGNQQGYNQQNWGGQQSYGQQGWGGQQSYGNGQQGWQQNGSNYGGGQGQGYGGYGNQDYNNYSGGQGKTRSAASGVASGGGYDSGYGGGYGGGKAQGGGSQQGYHPYKR